MAAVFDEVAFRADGEDLAEGGVEELSAHRWRRHRQPPVNSHPISSSTSYWAGGRRRGEPRVTAAGKARASLSDGAEW